MLAEPAFDEAFARILVGYAHRWDIARGQARTSPDEQRSGSS